MMPLESMLPPGHKRHAVRVARLLFFFAILLSLTAFQQVPSSGQDSFSLTTITGEERQVPKLSISDGIVEFDGESISLDRLISIQTGLTAVAEKSPVEVHLAVGGRLGASSFRFTGEEFAVDCQFGQFLFPPEAVMGIVADTTADLSRFHRTLENRSLDSDTVIAKTSSGQGVVEGIIESITDEKLKIIYRGQSRTIDRSKVVALVTANLKPQQPQGTRAVVRLIDGSTIGGSLKAMGDQNLQLVVPGGSAVQVAVESIAGISVQSDRVVYLSDLNPVDVEQNSLATVDFGWKRDASVLGNPIRLYSTEQGRTVEYERGIGTHAAARLEFDAGGNFDRFAATVGIDAETGGKGSCIVRVWGDGIKLWEAEINATSEPEVVDLDISGMQRVSLVVRNGQHLDLGDHVDWANARFLNTE